MDGLKLICSFSLAFLIACGSSTKKDCSISAASQKGYKDGLEGVDYRLPYFNKKCRNKKKYSRYYNEGMQLGLEKFCSYQRGKKQASLGLNSEKICLPFEDYQKGHQDYLKKYCSQKQGALDSFELKYPSIHLCTKIVTYSKAYTQSLERQCGSKQAYSMGLARHKLGSVCQDIKNYPLFLNSYNKGLSDSLSKENQILLKKITPLKLQRNRLTAKNQNTKNPQVNQKNRIKLNKLESQILKYQHEIEVNKKRIQTLQKP